MLEVQSRNLCNRNNTKIFSLIALLVFKVIEPQSFVYKQKRQQKLLKSRLPFKKLANLTGKLLQNYKQLEYESFWIFFKPVRYHLSVLFQFAWLYL